MMPLWYVWQLTAVKISLWWAGAVALDCPAQQLWSWKWSWEQHYPAASLGGGSSSCYTTDKDSRSSVPKLS